jgi:hypothetical protein
MKIALCVSGAPRFRQRGLFKLMAALKGWDQADFFIRTWKTDEYGNSAKEFVDYLKDNGLGDPDRFRYPVVQVLDDVPEHYPPPVPLNLAEWAPNFLTLWYGIVKTNELRLRYQRETGTEYDLVLRMRTDMVPDGDIDLTQYTDPNKMYNAKNFADNFLFGTPDMYNRFVAYWGHLRTLSAQNTFVHPEESLENYFKQYNIPYECIPVTVQPTWDRGEYKGRWRADHQ